MAELEPVQVKVCPGSCEREVYLRERLQFAQAHVRILEGTIESLRDRLAEHELRTGGV